MSPMNKPNNGSPMKKPEVKTPVHKLSGWDKFKNFFARTIINPIGGLVGAPEAHIIKESDYVKGKDGKDVFSWDKANKDFKEREGRDRRKFDLGKAIGTGTKALAML